MFDMGFRGLAVEAGGMGGFDLQERRAGEDCANDSMQDRVSAFGALPAPVFHDAGRYCRENGVAHVVYSYSLQPRTGRPKVAIFPFVDSSCNFSLGYALDLLCGQFVIIFWLFLLICSKLLLSRSYQ